jgi:integrase
MEPPDDSPNPHPSRLDEAVRDRLDALEAGNTRRATATALDYFADFLRSERGVDTLEDLTVQDCRRFAQQLRRDVHDDEFAATTAQQYYARVRATCTWWVEDERLATNPAKAKRAQAELPEDTANRTRQSWSPAQRKQLLRYTDRRVDEVLDEAADDAGTDDEAVLLAYRDRALAYLLAWSGVRGAEILRDPVDDKRTGITWADIDPEGVVHLLGKTREREVAPLRDPVQRRLARWKEVLDPPTEEWPVFPPLSKGTLCQTLSEAEGRVDLDSSASVRARFDACSALDVVPPAVGTNTGRQVMQRLTAAADIDVDEGYLEPHGARRGLGDAIYDQDPVAAQDTLRHKSIETTNEAYREKQQAERARQLDEMFEDS